MDPIRELEERLERALKTAKTAAAKAGPDPEKQIRAAFAKGIGHALKMVRELLGQDPETKDLTDAPTTGLRLHEMPPEDVAQMAPANELETGYPRQDLVEAAFRFETLLLSLLEDDNTLPYDAYKGLAPEQLARIIKKSAEDICRIKNH